ncbi:MAG: hypothetical protein ACI8QF_000880, partial [Limisphaerales bacterium]
MPSIRRSVFAVGRDDLLDEKLVHIIDGNRVAG